MKRKRSARSRVFDSHLPLSWLRILHTLVSYALLFSDVARSGIGVRDFASTATMLEPDTFIEFGPWAYSVQRLFKNETSMAESPLEGVKLWTYKFDTTSLVWRSFAEFFALEAFPDCVLYRSECASSYLSTSVVFNMTDSLPTAIAQTQGCHPDQPVVVALSTESLYFDRLHHYILPSIFITTSWRMHQAFYYPPQLLTHANFGTCSGRSIRGSSRPYFCQAHWVNYRRSCHKSDSECQSIGSVSSHIVQRLRARQLQFPDLQVDLTILESEGSIGIIRGGICFAGRRDVDISTILRVRKCSSSPVVVNNQQPKTEEHCETIFVDDYRYEAVIVTSDVMQWYFLVASLRFVGQSYFYLRALTLFLSCYVTRCAEEKYERAGFMVRLKAAALLFIRVPCQCVIHGSTFPILCYVCAHMIDAPLTYELVVGRLTTTNGLLHLSLWEFCLIAAVQMRSLWLLVLFLQCLMALLTLRRYPEWTPSHGILGVSGLSVSIVSSWTVFGQFRSLSLRQTPVVSINELPQSSSTPQAIKHHLSYTQQGAGNALYEGVILDFKLFLCALALLVTLSVLQAYLVTPLQHAYCQRAKKQPLSRAGSKFAHQPGELQVSKRPAVPHTEVWTPVPYSARVLWPITAMCARWRGSLFNDPERRSGLWFGIVKSTSSIFSSAPVAPEPSRRGSAALSLILHSASMAPSSVHSAFASRRKSTGVDINTTTNTRAQLNGVGFGFEPTVNDVPPEWTSWPKTGRGIDTLLFLQFHMENIHVRHEDVDAIVAFLNLVLLSDPLVFFALKVNGTGQPLAFYESTCTAQQQSFGGGGAIDPGRIVLLPPATAVKCFARRELRLLLTVNSAELSWSDLVHCG